MSSAMIAIGEGIAGAANLNEKTEITTGSQLLGDMGIYLTLSESWSQVLSTDQSNYELAVLQTLSPNAAADGAAAGAAKAYEQYTNDESAQSKDTGNVRTLIDNQQSLLRNEASSMETIFSMGPLVGSINTWTSGLLRS